MEPRSPEGRSPVASLPPLQLLAAGAPAVAPPAAADVLVLVPPSLLPQPPEGRSDAPFLAEIGRAHV